jgi:hypothetical protein
MRSLSEDERLIIGRRRAAFDGFLAERMPALADFMSRLELPEPPLVLVEAERYLPQLDRWLRDQQVPDAPDDPSRLWLLTRLGYYVGEYLVQRHVGHWFLNETPDTRFFGKYVVGSFYRAHNPNAMVDAFGVAQAYLQSAQGRPLKEFLDQVECEIAMA